MKQGTRTPASQLALVLWDYLLRFLVTLVLFWWSEMLLSLCVIVCISSNQMIIYLTHGLLVYYVKAISSAGFVIGISGFHPTRRQLEPLLNTIRRTLGGPITPMWIPTDSFTSQNGIKSKNCSVERARKSACVVVVCGMIDCLKFCNKK